MWKNLVMTGVRKRYGADLSYKIILSNKLALIVALTAVVYAVLSSYYAPLLVFFCILVIFLSFLPIFLNGAGEYNASRWLLGILGATAWSLFHALLTPAGSSPVAHLYLQALVSLGVPFLLFDLEERTPLYTSVGWNFVWLLLFPYLNLWAGDFSEGSNPMAVAWQVSAYLMALAYLASMFFLLLHNQQYIHRKNEALLKTTAQKNADLQISQQNLENTLAEVEKARQEEAKRTWASKGFAMFGDLLRVNQSMQEVYDLLIAEIIRYLGCHQGALYLAEEDIEGHPYLELIGCFASGRKKYLHQKIEILGEDLLGQCYLEKAPIYIEQVPADFLKIRSGLGEARPSALLLVPLKMQENIEGVLELASFKPFEQYQIEFLVKLGETIASTVTSIRVNEQTLRLLKESQEYTEELQAQEEEMRQNMEELQATQEAMNQKQQELEDANRRMVANERILKKAYEKMRESESEIREKNETLKASEQILKQNMEELSVAQAQMEKKQRELEAINTKMAANENILKKAYDKIRENELLINQKNEDLLINQAELKQSMEELEANREELRAQKEALEETYQELKQTTNMLTDSIVYAERIQQAILPNEELFLEHFQEFCIIFRPKDIVSGDFYWMIHIEGKTFVAIVDCTGHGVPGAFMSMIGSSLLNQIVGEKRVFEPHKILENLHLEVRRALRQQSSNNNDGMDLSLIRLEKQNEQNFTLTFAGAKSTMYYFSEDELNELKGDRKAIGGYQQEEYRSFTAQTITLSKGDTLYLTSDGLTDMPNQARRKFGTKKLKEILYQEARKPMIQQENTLLKALQIHQGRSLQRDDVTFIGLRI